ncbi:otoancorin-like [Argopecten irradians]|uniref:otoancorin-like n=1 Tax=Argopecten irradians TaxID=31199 RepID=UPI003718BBDF
MEYMESQSVPITLERVGNILAYACAFTEEQINNFVKDDFYLDILYTLVGSPCTSAERIDFLQGLIKDYTSFDSMTAAALTEQTTSATLESIPPNILVRYTRTELLKYGSDLCWKIVDLLSHVDIYVVSRAQIQEAYQYSISCLGKSTGTLTADDLVSLGTMICGLSSLDYDRLSSQALEDFIKQLQRDCPLTYDERVALTSKYVAAKGLTNGTGIRSSDISRLATLFPLLPSSVLSAISDEVLLAEAGTLLDELKEQEKFEESRKQSGLSSDISDGDRTAFESAKRLLYETIATALQSSANTAARRRKRSTASLTCSDLQTLQKSGLSALSTTQLTSLADEDFVDCVEILGAVIDFSEEQETSLLNVAMRTTVWGEPSTWSTDNVYNAGVICQAMSETQITSLTFNLDAVSRLGEFDGWTSVKKKAVFDRWLNQLKGGDSSSITVSELRSLGHITCGAETSHISVIPHTVYKDAADSVGELTSCNDTQLTAFATLAKAAYGSNVTSWLSSVISNIGVIIGGLSTDDVVLLSSTQIDAIDPNHIPYFPPDIFAGFTVEQFFTFSSAQSSKTTTEQRQALSAAQLAALQLDFSSDDAPRTAASSNFVVVLLPLVLMFLQLT